MAVGAIQGLIAAPVQPMHSDGGVNLELVRAQQEGLMASGVDGVFICGTTGEGMSLTVDERRQIAERWRSVAPREGFSVIVHVGHNCLRDARNLARHAQEIGADAIGCLPPFYYRPRRVSDLVAFCREVASAATELPFFYYHIPSMTNVNLPMAELLEAGRQEIPSLAGIKFTGEDLSDFIRCLRVDPERFRLLFGRDEYLLAGLAVGGEAGIGSTLNIAAPLFRRVLDAWRGGEWETAQAAQAKAAELVTVVNQFGGVPAVKAVLRLSGFDCGPVRLPLLDLSDEQAGRLGRVLEGIGFFSWATHYRVEA